VLREKVSQEPILGYSFGQGEAVARVYDFEYGGFHMLHMHNVVMGALTNLGILGFILLTFLFLNSIKCIFSFKEKLSRPFMLAATFATMLNALSISSISSPLSFGWISQAMFISY
jgi:O-antigen ligase